MAGLFSGVLISQVASSFHCSDSPVCSFDALYHSKTAVRVDTILFDLGSSVVEGDSKHPASRVDSSPAFCPVWLHGWCYINEAELKLRQPKGHFRFCSNS